MIDITLGSYNINIDSRNFSLFKGELKFKVDKDGVKRAYNRGQVIGHYPNMVVLLNRLAHLEVIESNEENKIENLSDYIREVKKVDERLKELILDMVVEHGLTRKDLEEEYGE